MKKLAWCLSLALWLNLATIAAAQTALFYDNTGPAIFGSAFTTDHEIADDVPFTGTQTVTAFSIFYHADISVNATFKFSSVNQSTGRVGATVATFTANNLASGDHVFTLNLSPAQQFAWTATPGIYGFSSVAGGFFSVRFSTPSGGSPGTSAGWREAGGASLDGFLDVTNNQFITFQGDTPASFYLQIAGAGGAAAPALSSLQITPLNIAGGTSAQGLVTLTNIAPAGGTVVTLESDKPQFAAVPSSVTVPAGATNVTFAVTTSPVTTNAAVAITASLNGIIRSVVVTVLAPQPADRVSVTQAEYRTSKRELRVEATSTASSATLQVYVTATNALIGTLQNTGGGIYRGQFSWPVNPQQITVRSSQGGSATRAVTQK